MQPFGKGRIRVGTAGCLGRCAELHRVARDVASLGSETSPKGRLRAGSGGCSIGYIFRPLLRAVKHAKSSDRVAQKNVSDNVGCSIDNQFARSVHSARAAALWVLQQSLYLRTDLFIDSHGGAWIDFFDLVENIVAVLKREWRPLKLHASRSFALRIAAARRLAK